MANYNLTQTGDEVQAYIDSIPVIDVTGTLSGSNIVFATNPYTQIAANYAAGCSSIVRLTVGTNVYLMPVTKKNSSTYTASVMIGAHNIVATITSSAASATIDSEIDDTPVSGSDNLVKSGGVYESSKLGNQIKIIDSSVDYAVGDDNGYDIVQFSEGHIKTKEFDSRYAIKEAEENFYDLAFVDVNDNVILGVSGGNVVSKNFSSIELANRVSELERNGRKNQILCVGDSLTAGAGANKNYKGETISPYYTYPQLLQSFAPDYSVIQLGVGGETSETILGRVGGVPYVINGEYTLPATTTPIEISLKSSWIDDNCDRLSVAPLLQGGDTQINPCYVEGIQCTLTYSSSKYYLQRVTAGNSAIKIVSGTPILTKTLVTYPSPKIIIFWIGSNGDVSIQRTEETVEKIREAAAVFGTSRYLVVAKHSTSSSVTIDDRKRQNRQFQSAFGYKFVNWLSYGSEQAIYDAIDKGYIDNSNNDYPTSADLTAMAEGKIPPTLMVDAAHLCQEGYKIFTDFIYAQLQSLNYI